ncbi:Dam family site-specific DNA-(adenine-N6)-methyltransferase [Achromobacter sp. Marseille-Q4954]|uniref:DNA adenine methylase n=1 Tax=Achromobacter sp. Marseille-Q4954 TaxID=2942203 RepID=UPI0020741B01|nr:Dam family site-specific DNA-(adenine-N6)-methyltransferase [Achromobacter sp. Marseille-Q4954]
MGKVVPFLKWAGGKRWLIPSIDLPNLQKYENYIEPFLGGGALYFSLLPKHAILSDKNPDLIETYAAIKTNPGKIASRLDVHQRLHSAEHFYQVRAAVPVNKFDRAARFIYLNRTCWNGLYRVNKKGQFNVPIGTKTNVNLDTDDWVETSKSLKSATITHQDFEISIDMAQDGDLVFADPPYTVKHNNNGFVKYNESIFSWQDQIRLKDCLLRAARRGATIILTNAAHDSIRDLYAHGFKIKVLERASVLSGSSASRGRFQELFITANYE